MRLVLLTISICGLAMASGTITPGARPGNMTCPTESADARLVAIDVESNEIQVESKKNGKLKMRVLDATIFRVPGASKQDLKDSPLKTLQPESEAKVYYCKDSYELLEIKVKK